MVEIGDCHGGLQHHALNQQGSCGPATGEPGQNDPHEVAVDWRDGTSGAARVSEDGASASASHTYSELGDHEIKVEVSDDDGGAGSRTTVVSVIAAQAEEPAAAEVDAAAD